MLFLALACLSRVPSAGDPSPEGCIDVAGEMSTAIRLRLPLVERAELERLYAANYAPLWLDQAGRPSRSAHDAFALLADASAHGLDPLEYGAANLAAIAGALEKGTSFCSDVVTFDLGLSASLLRFLRHVHRGRVEPHEVSLRLDLPTEKRDLVRQLRVAVEGGRVGELVAEMSPPFAQYEALRRMLARYGSLTEGTNAASPKLSGRTLVPGERDERVPALRRLLARLGDLPDAASRAAPGDVYDGAVVAGVKRFQLRHGLDPDGVIGTQTQAALAVPIERRVQQIELALERMRWLPDLRGQRVLTLNIPMFYLSGWEGDYLDGQPSLGMRAIVGTAEETQTPVFRNALQAVIFRPYWNIPTSILRAEILPIVERDPGYLRREDMEIVRGAGDDASPVAVTDKSLVRLAHGELRMRQRPGPRNALGLVKFLFPNEANVYLHGTPAPKLFARSRRDFSHGCVRVEAPLRLAEWVLKNEPGWTLEQIEAAAADAEHVSRAVALTRPIQILLLYTTASVMSDGTIHFADDIYGHDATLDSALAEHQLAQ
jgi:L,D-transpeptidase YcbB